MRSLTHRGNLRSARRSCRDEPKREASDVFDQIRGWLGRLSRAGEEPDSYAGSDPRLSVAAILVHIVAVDGVVTENEKRRLRDCLKNHYGLSQAETEALVEEATERDDDAVDLYSFTSVIKREHDEDERRDIVELMWEMVFADGEVNEFEDNVVWRVAELIGVSTRDRMTIRKKIEEKHARG
jgi:uncharacterized tellurite resistance protein B-like protein